MNYFSHQFHIALFGSVCFFVASESPAQNNPNQAQTPPPSIELPMLTISAPRLNRELYDTPRAVSVIEEQAIIEGQQRVQLDESLVRVPGVFVQNRDNFAQGQRIAVRGFGARAPFGVRGITVLINGMPQTLPDGQAQLDLIDLDSAEKIEVIRGPSSVLYGNAAGGVISVTTADGRSNPGTRLRAEVGSFGYRKASLQTGGSSGDLSHHFSISALGIDGFREQSAAQKYLLNAQVRRDLPGDRALSALVTLLDNPVSEDPGALNARELESRRDQAAPNSLALDARQRVDQQLIGFQYEDLTTNLGELYLKSFVTQRDFEQQLPFFGDSHIGFKRDYLGGSAELRRSDMLSGLPLRSVTGLDVAHQNDDRFRRSANSDGSGGELLAQETQRATSTGLFSQAELEFSEQTALTLGVRFDRVKLSIKDRFLSDGDQSGEQTFNEWSGSAALNHRYRPEHQLYVNTSTAFETPTFSEFANPAGGGFNPALTPQKAWNREVGARGKLRSLGMDYDLALFSVLVRGELIPFDNGGRTFFQNAADTHRSGAEVALGWQLTDSWRLDSALTLARYEFDQFSVGDQRFDGNRLPGLPEQTWVNQLGWRGERERFAVLETQYTGDLVADNSGETKVGGYWLMNLRAGRSWQQAGQTQLKSYVGLRNLLAEDYNTNVRLNAGFGRSFEPAPGRSVYGGLEVSF